MRIGDAHDARTDLEHLPGTVAQLKDVSDVALDREVLVERADEQLLRIEHDAIVRVLRDGAAGGHRDQPCRTASRHAALDFVAMDQRAAPAPPCRDAIREHPDDAVEALAFQCPVGPGTSHEPEQIVLPPVRRRGFGDDLLGQHVERRIV
jgi:hypothetical protein